MKESIFFTIPRKLGYFLINNLSMKNKILVGAIAVAIAAVLWSLDGTFYVPNYILYLVLW